MEVKSEVGCCSGSLSSWPLEEVKVAGESYPTTLGGPPPIQRKRYLSINNMERIAMKVFTKLISLYHQMPQRLLGIRWESVIRHMQIYIKKHCYVIVNIFMQRKLNAWFFYMYYIWVQDIDDSTFIPFFISILLRSSYFSVYTQNILFLLTLI